MRQSQAQSDRLNDAKNAAHPPAASHQEAVLIPEKLLDGLFATGRPDAAADARTFTRLSQSHPFRASQGLLHMQRVHGNRYVQRVLALSRQGQGEGEVNADVEASIERSRGGGQAMESATKTQMESAFDADFSSVRIHTGAESHALNRAVSAVAFTTGADIFFREGAYDPGSSGGKQLLAHELTHVVQQGAAASASGKANRFEIDRMCADCEEGKNKHIQTKLLLGSADDVHEREADHVASVVTAGIANSSTLQRASFGSIRRESAPSQQVGEANQPASRVPAGREATRPGSSNESDEIFPLLGRYAESDYSGLDSLNDLFDQEASVNGVSERSGAPANDQTIQSKSSIQREPAATPAQQRVRMGTAVVVPTSFSGFFQGKAPANSRFAAETSLKFGLRDGRISVDQDRTKSWVDGDKVTADGVRSSQTRQTVKRCEAAFKKWANFSTKLPQGCPAQAAAFTPHTATNSGECETAIGAALDAEGAVAARLLLRHEQYHMLLAWRIASAGNDMIDQKQSPKKVKAALIRAVNEQQRAYDSQSIHGCDSSQQQAWEAKIDDPSTRWLQGSQ